MASIDRRLRERSLGGLALKEIVSGTILPKEASRTRSGNRSSRLTLVSSSPINALPNAGPLTDELARRRAAGSLLLQPESGDV